MSWCLLHLWWLYCEDPLPFCIRVSFYDLHFNPFRKVWSKLIHKIVVHRTYCPFDWRYHQDILALLQSTQSLKFICNWVYIECLIEFIVYNFYNSWCVIKYRFAQISKWSIDYLRKMIFVIRRERFKIIIHYRLFT